MPPVGDDQADTKVTFVEQVEKAINRGVAWLKAKQQPDGSWGVIEGPRAYDPNYKGHIYDYPAGPTSLALYTLLKCKVPAEDEVVAKGFAFLKAKQPSPKTSYEVSMELLAVTATADPFKRIKASEAAGERVKLVGEWRKWAEDLQTLLLKKHHQLGWRYNSGVPAVGGDEDSSGTQLACLALLAAERCGISAPSQVYADAITFALAQQEPDGPPVARAIFPRADSGAQKAKTEPVDPGAAYARPAVKDRARGFSYIRQGAVKYATLEPYEENATGGMTACGIATLLMSRYILMRRDDKTWKQLDAAAIQQSIYDGFAWLDSKWSAVENVPKDVQARYHVYYQYCVERAMDLTGSILLGKHDWYAEMGQRLIATQKPAGFWDTHSTHPPYDTLDTSFALLFLKRATRGGIPYPAVTGGSDSPPPTSPK